MSVCWITCIVILPTPDGNNLDGEKSQEKTGAMFKLTLRQWSSGDDLPLSDSRHKWAFYHWQVPGVVNHEQWLLPFLYFVICFLYFHLLTWGHLQMQVWLIWQWLHFESLTTDDAKLPSNWAFPFEVGGRVSFRGGREGKVKERVISKNGSLQLSDRDTKSH